MSTNDDFHLDFHPFEQTKASHHASATSLQRAWSLNNSAVEASAAGDNVKAERLHADALNLKTNALGPDDVGVGLSANGLGEAQIRLGKWEDAEKNLLNAVRIRNEKGPKFDMAVSRDNLAQIYEYKGDFTKAREIRTHFPSLMTCSHYHCPVQGCQKMEVLKQCSRCKCTFYCSQACQKRDWARHKQFCKSE